MTKGELFPLWFKQLNCHPSLEEVARELWSSYDSEDIYIEDYSDGSYKVVVKE